MTTKQFKIYSQKSGGLREFYLLCPDEGKIYISENYANRLVSEGSHTIIYF